MGPLRIAAAIAAVWLIGAGQATSESADCRAKLKRQDEQCQALAEKLAAACPTGTNIKETARCSALSAEIARSCTRKPCAPPPRKRKTRAKGMGMGMGAPKKAAKP